MNMQRALHFDLPGSDLSTAKMPGHWLLARLGKRVLRPGGLAMTRAMLQDIQITRQDDVVELAPGLGSTARHILAAKPRSYVGVERDVEASSWSRRQLPRAHNISVLTGSADDTGLLDGCASVVVGEAMLTMNTAEHKRRIVEEAHRLLKPGGRYAIHELCVSPDTITAAEHDRISQGLSSAIHVGARPLRAQGWMALLEQAGFQVVAMDEAPMDLLRPKRLVQDEGVMGALRIAGNILLDPPARKRVLGMRAVFEQHRKNLSAIYIVAVKSAPAN
ncbi:methyltransferase domain-containing protein [Sphingopyxis sp. SE2]|uniref:class I SAM-dependent methyltransferase n=1 Tax=Sphingopyxis sp. SE2 TaxID=1586240 RepID=UPI0028BFD2AB|nr:methyltransferase domain-containing protein [Sphingopyxis sp. SE2]MDT7527778.1 methyltransferase domain-containing protein [Sphingopyxis sp. SE2]